MKAADLMASLALHGAVFGAVAWSGLSPAAPDRREEIPVFFEIVEAAAPSPSREPQPLERTPVRDETVETAAEAETAGEPEAPDVPDVPDVPEDLDAPDVPEVPDAPDVPDQQETVGEPETPDEPVAPTPIAAPMEEEERAKVVSDPCALNRISPVYPRAARRKGHEGRVTVEVDVAEDGGIVRAEVVASSGFPELDAAAVSAVRTARFAPATEDGVSVRGLLRLTFDFRLR